MISDVGRGKEEGSADWRRLSALGWRLSTCHERADWARAAKERTVAWARYDGLWQKYDAWSEEEELVTGGGCSDHKDVIARYAHSA